MVLTPATRLHIIMPCARPQNIPILSERYLRGMEPHPFELRWHILLQGPEPDPKGILKVNEMIDSICDGWFMCVADDTDQHPRLFRRLAEVIVENPEAGVIVFGQDRGHGKLMQPRGECIPCQICGGQVVFRREFIGDYRFNWEECQGICDGYFLQALHQLFPKAFVFKTNEVLMRFGSLEW